MKRLTTLLLISMTFVILFALPSCNKLIPIRPISAVLQYCPITKMISKATTPSKSPLDSVEWETDFTYDGSGNPLSISWTNPVPTWYYFWYDKQKRLINYQLTYNPDGRDSGQAELWHHLTYSQNGIIVDSEFAYPGIPNTAFTAPLSTFDGAVSTIHLDKEGRIVQVEGASAGSWSYNVNGDLVIPDVTYDDKVSPAQTNSVWMFLSRNYSKHNPLTANGTPDVTFTYDSYGLPTYRVSEAVGAVAGEPGFLGQFYGFGTAIYYGCDVGAK